MGRLIVDIQDKIALITFDNPPVNALSDDLIAEIGQVFEELLKVEDLRVVVLTSAGEKAFAAGADIKVFSQTITPEFGFNSASNNKRVFKTIQNFPCPVIVAVTGYAFGGGFELAMAGDIRIMSDRAKIGLPEIKLGLLPGDGGTVRLPRIIGRSKALEMMLTGDHISAQEALDLGLCNYLAEPNKVLNEAMDLAKKIAENAPLAARSIKRAVNEGYDLSMDAASVLESELERYLFGTEDAIEGINAFLDKRTPNFSGK